MELTKEEEEIILVHRRERKRQLEYKKKQESCLHTNMYYAGHSHNDDCYECKDCGYYDWR